MSLGERALRLAARLGLLDEVGRRNAYRGRYVLMFHGISSRKRRELPESLQPCLDRADLEAVLAWLRPRFRLLDADEFAGGTLPGVLLTFDDGYRNNHDQALPALVAADAPAVLFVTTRHVAEPRDWLPSIRREIGGSGRTATDVPEELARDLYDGMSSRQLARCAAHESIEIGSHTVSHPFLTTLDDVDLTTELARSKRQLEAWTSHPVRWLAYPTGDYDRRVSRAAERCGYEAAFAENRRRTAHQPRFEVPRIGLYRSDAWYLAAKLSGLFRRPLPLGDRGRAR